MAPMIPQKRDKDKHPRKESWAQRKERAASEGIEPLDNAKGAVRKLFAEIAKEMERRRWERRRMR